MNALNRDGSDFDKPLQPIPTDPVGAIPGSFAVTDRGLATYRIPIAVPPGRLGLQPALSLNYSSTKANGMLGLGWSLSGFTNISRCMKTLARDGVAASVRYDSNDRFCLDGVGLIPPQAVSTPAGTVYPTGDYYRTEIDDFSRIRPYGSQTTSDGKYIGPRYFEVETKDGRLLRYGFNTDASVFAAGTPIKRVWALDRILDRAGNRLDVHYMLASAQRISPRGFPGSLLGAAALLGARAPNQTETELLPRWIEYGASADLSVPHSRFVTFTYETRPDRQFQYVSGMPVSSRQRLKEIGTFIGDRSAPVRKYALHYSSVAEDEVEQLDHVDEFGSDAGAGGAAVLVRRGGGTSFTYQTPATATPYQWNRMFSAADGSVGWNPGNPIVFLDLDGNGQRDIVFSDSQGTKVRINTGSAEQDGVRVPTFSAYSSQVSNGLTPGSEIAQLLPPADPGPPLPLTRLTGLDIDGDRRAELLLNDAYLGLTGTGHIFNAPFAVFERRNMGGALAPEGQLVQTMFRESRFNSTAGAIRTGDWNGDSLVDAMVCVSQYVGPSSTPVLQNAINATRNWTFSAYALLNDGNRLAQKTETFIPKSCTGLDTLDVDNDGKAELVETGAIDAVTHQYAQGVGLRWTLEGNAFVSSGLADYPINVQDTVLPRQIGDFNGDGLQDIIDIEDGRLVFWRGTGLGFSPVELSSGAGTSLPTLTDAAVIDLDGDGRDDLVFGTGFGSTTGTCLVRLVAESTLQVRQLSPESRPGLRTIPDVNGDGDPEMMDRNWRVVLSVGAPRSRLLRSVQDGLGRRVEVNYDIASGEVPQLTYSVSTCSSDVAAGYQCVAEVGPLVSSYHESQVLTAFKPGVTHRYRYFDARRGLRGRGSYGFSRREETRDDVEMVRVTSYHNQSFVLAGRVNGSSTRWTGIVEPDEFATRSTGHETATTYQWEIHSGPRPFPYIASESTAEIEYQVVPGPGDQPVTTGSVTSQVDRSHSVDAEGNETASTTVTFVSGLPKTSTYVLTPRTFRGRVRGLVESLTIEDSRGGDPFVRTVRYDYDTNGALKLVEREPSAASSPDPEVMSLYKRTDIVPDAFGSPQSTCSRVMVRVDGANQLGPPRCSNIEEYSDDHFFARKIVTSGSGTSGELALDTRVNYSPETGQLLVSRDAGGRLSETAFDAFGRVSQVLSPTSEGTFHYEQRSAMESAVTGVTSYGALAVIQTMRGEGVTESVVDAFGREVSRQTPGLLGAQVRTERVYDSGGHVVMETLPHLPEDGSLGVVTYEYDVRKRTSVITNPDGTSVRFSYPTAATSNQNWFLDGESAGARVVVDARDTVKASLFGARGELMHSITTSLGGTEESETSYSYFPFDLPALVLGPKDGINIFPDAWGRVRARNDSSQGFRLTTYNGFDEVETETDAKSMSRRYIRDGLGRMSEEREGTSDDGPLLASWIYDGEELSTQGLLVGMYRREQNEPTHGTWMNFTYSGERGLPSSVEYRVGGTPNDSTSGESFKIVNHYQDEAHVPWRIGAISYPNQGDAFAIKYGYDSGGTLLRVGRAASATNPDPNPDSTNDPAPYWQIFDVEGGLRPTLEQFGNGVTTHTEYFHPSDCATGVEASCLPSLIKSISTAKGATSPLLAEAYEYDQRGSLRRLTPNGDFEQRKTFEYDIYDQLEAVTTYRANGLVFRVPTDIDSSGDIQQNASYVYAGARPHVLERIERSEGTTEYTFDPNGNLERRDGFGVPGTTQSFSYNDFGMPSRVDSGGTEGTITKLEYDPSLRRISKTTTRPGGASESRLYIGNLFERAISSSGATTYTYKVYAGRREVLHLTRHQGVETERYLHTDRLGSTRTVTDAQGGSVEPRSFTEFGATPTFDPLSLGGASGFTGHEHDEDLGLINMRGRLYDSLAKRFIQPDPVVADPATAIGLNPYAYVRNNPHKYVDPSGFCTTIISANGKPVNISSCPDPAAEAASAQAASQAAAQQQAAAQAAQHDEANRRTMEGHTQDGAGGSPTGIPWSSVVPNSPQGDGGGDRFNPYDRGVFPGTSLFGGSDSPHLNYFQSPITAQSVIEGFISPFESAANAPGFDVIPASRTTNAEFAFAVGMLFLGGKGRLAAGEGGGIRMGLGLGEAPGRVGYRAWAESQGLRTWDEIAPRMYGGDLPRVQSAMRSADELHFNMEGFRAPQAPQLGVRFGEPVSGYSNFEYSMMRTQYAEKSFYWLGDQPFIGPHRF